MLICALNLAWLSTTTNRCTRRLWDAEVSETSWTLWGLWSLEWLTLATAARASSWTVGFQSVFLTAQAESSTRLGVCRLQSWRISWKSVGCHSLKSALGAIYCAIGLQAVEYCCTVRISPEATILPHSAVGLVIASAVSPPRSLRKLWLTPL